MGLSLIFFSQCITMAHWEGARPPRILVQLLMFLGIIRIQENENLQSDATDTKVSTQLAYLKVGL